jgi:hypothetical protein
MSRRVPGVLALLLLLPLAACAGEEEPASSSEETSEASPSESAEPSDEPSEDAGEDEGEDAEGGDDEDADSGGGGNQGDGYSFDGPQGWADATERFAAMTPGVDLGLMDTEGQDPRFADNVNVLVGAPYPAFSPEEAEQTFLEELSGFARQAKVLPRVEIDDRGAVHLAGRTPVGRIKVYTEQYAAYVDETWYIVTFSHGPDSTAAEREEDMSTVLDSWTWGAGDDA